MIFAAANTDYGIFGPLVTATSAIMAAGGAIVLLWAGPLEKWRPPDADLPDQARRMIFLACSVIMALLTYRASPQTINFMEISAWFLLGAGIVLGILYSALRFGLYHSKIKPSGKGRELVLGGLWMTNEAKTAMKEHNIRDIDGLLDGADSPSRIWSGPSRFFARVLMMATFILFLVSSTAALIEAGLIVYVTTTGKALFTS
jgi:hypothetical protein